MEANYPQPWSPHNLDSGPLDAVKGHEIIFLLVQLNQEQKNSCTYRLKRISSSTKHMHSEILQWIVLLNNYIHRLQLQWLSSSIKYIYYQDCNKLFPLPKTYQMHIDCAIDQFFKPERFTQLHTDFNRFKAKLAVSQMHMDHNLLVYQTQLFI